MFVTVTPLVGELRGMWNSWAGQGSALVQGQGGLGFDVTTYARGDAMSLNELRWDAGKSRDIASSIPMKTHPTAVLNYVLHFMPRTKTFHLRAGPAQYSFCVDTFGHLEHLYTGPWVGVEQDLTYLSETDPALVWEPAPAGARLDKAQLLKQAGAHSGLEFVWQVSVKAGGAGTSNDTSKSWEMARVQNLTWRLRHRWGQKFGVTKGSSSSRTIFVVQ